MRTQTFIIYFLFSTIFSFAQKTMEIGLRINSININKQTKEFGNLNNPNNSNTVKLNLQSLSIDLYSNIILIKKIPLRVWGGYYRIKNSTFETNNFTNGETATAKEFQQISTYRFGTGIGRCIYNDRIKIKVGPEVIFFYSVAEKTNLTIDNFDTNGNKFKTTYGNIEQPPYYSIGAGLFATAYYPIWKGFSLGIELSNYLLLGKSKGDIKTDYQYFDGNGVQTGTDSKTDKVNYSGINTSYLNVAIGISYQF